jgi:WD40 repeat protein
VSQQESGDTVAEPKRYRAFISYSRKDCEWGVRLHRWLETYRVPIGVIADIDSTRKLGRFFRDREEMPAASSIAAVVQDAIENCENLIVICSPNAAKSQWVEAEIRHFRSTGRGDRVFAFIVDGLPNSADPEKECFPPSFRNSAEAGAMPVQPLGLDIREEGQDRACARLASGLLNISFDDLWQREARRRRQELQRARGMFAAGLALVALAIAGGYLAADNYVDASERRAALFAREANSLSDQGEHAKAMLIAIAGDPAARAGFLERLMRPDGFVSARAALVRATAENRLVFDRARFGDIRDEARSSAISADGKLLLIGYNNLGPEVWSLQDNRAVADFKLRGAQGDDLGGTVTAVAFAPDNRHFLTGSDDAKVRLWTIENPEPQAVLEGHTGSIHSLGFSPDGATIITASKDRSVRLWSADGKQQFVLRSDGISNAAALWRDGGSILAANGAAPRLWQLSNGRWTATDFKAQGAMISSLAFANNASTFIASTEDNALRIYARMTGPWDTLRSGEARMFAIASGSGYILAGDEAGVLHLWAAPRRFSFDPDYRYWAAFRGRFRERFPAHGKAIRHIFVAADGGTMATSADDGVKVWRLDRSRRVFKMDAEFVAYSADGRCALSFSTNEGAYVVWSTTTGDPIVRLQAQSSEIVAVALSHNGQTVATGSADGAIELWSIADGSIRSGPMTFGYAVRSITFSQDDSHVGITGGNSSEIWSLDGARKVADLPRASSVVFSPDGANVAVAPDYSGLAIHSAATGIELRDWRLEADVEGDDYFSHPAYSRDGKMLAAGATDKLLRVWSPTDGKAIATFSGHEDHVSAAAFSPDGNYLVSGSIDGDVKLWSANGGHTLGGQHNADGEVEHVWFSTDATSYSAAFENGTVKSWDIDPITFATAREQLRIACARLKLMNASRFTAQDRERFAILTGVPDEPCNR